MRSPTLSGSLRALVLLLASSVPLHAQWDPPNGDWLEEFPTDLRVMTWNVEDGICSSNFKDMPANDWAALARIVAAMKPDVLILQEVGDNQGQGTGTGVDSVSTLKATIGLFLHGGIDPFRTGFPPVTEYVQAHDPGYDLPFVFVSSNTDGFNRDVILSRYPFTDLNGDTISQYSDMPFVLADAYASGGDGGLRGYQLAEIDLPDEDYSGDLVIGNSHLKAGSSSSDHNQRIDAARNMAYFIDYFYNGAGLGVPDPNGMIFDTPPATSILDDSTVFVTGGDWNEDEDDSFPKGPAAWIANAAVDDLSGGTDGTDRDRTDMVLDASLDVFTGSDATRVSKKLDYVAWQDSIAGRRRGFVFNTGNIPSGGFPPELLGFFNPAFATVNASDHRPVIVDLILPAPPSIYGCLNPLGSLSVVGGSTSIGDTLILGVDNPLGTQGAGSLPFLALASAPDPAFPCGLLLPGFGMSGPGAPGEILIAFQPPNPLLTIPGPPWVGPGVPAQIPIALPPNPALVGLALYAQGILLDLVGPVRFGLTVGVAFVIGA